MKTGDDGKATTKGLYLGAGSATYAFVETKAPSGHVLDETPTAFTLSYEDGATAEVKAASNQSDAPTRFDVYKIVKGGDTPLPGAKFQIWNADDEISIGNTAGNLAVRAEAGSEVSIRKAVAAASVKADIDDGTSLMLKSANGMETTLGADAVDMEPGTYTMIATRDGKTLEGEEVEIEAGKTYTAKVATGLLGGHATLSDDGYAMPAIRLAWSEVDSAYEGRGLDSGAYDLTVSGKPAGSIAIDEDGTTYASVSGGKARRVPVLLKEGKSAKEGVTGADGSISFWHLAAGTYRVAEIEAPAGYVEAPEIKTFTVGTDGRIEGREAGQTSFEDDFTKVRISKRDITDESEVEGAKLTVTDSEGKTVDSWTSTTEDHEIDALAPGKYTLTEQRTPTTYDQAESIEFEVRKTGEVQTVTMYDSPISISGEIDKRQEIADPTAKDTDANGDGLNTAETKASDDGSYAYTIDFRSTSNTWTDEFTVEDDLTAAVDGRAQLTSITTPQTLDDYDGKMNVWYRTDKTPDDYIDESGANATLSDGHENPWLSDEATASILGEDGRAVDFTGWRLWRADVPTTVAAELAVADLGLEEGEHVTAIRFEYGRVEQGFTTRDGGWDRDGIKDAHDDIASAEDTAKENGSHPDGSGDGPETAYAPAIVRMKATDGYTAGTSLDNYARVDLTRNGGGDSLEDHDEDQVTQTAKAVTVPPTNLDQTGRNVIIGLAATLAAAAAAAAALIYRRRIRGSAADDDDPDDDGYGREDYGHEDRYGDGYDRAGYGYDDRYRDEIRDRY